MRTYRHFHAVTPKLVVGCFDNKNKYSCHQNEIFLQIFHNANAVTWMKIRDKYFQLRFYENCIKNYDSELRHADVS